MQTEYVAIGRRLKSGNPARSRDPSRDMALIGLLIPEVVDFRSVQVFRLPEQEAQAAEAWEAMVC